MTDAVHFSDLSYAYTPGAWVLRGYSGAIPKGGIFSILGPNGSGKTTLLMLLLGLLKPASGAVTTMGHIAMVPQIFQVTFAFSVLDMVLMGRARQIGLFSQPSRRDVDVARSALERVGIADLEQRSFHELSGGQRQLVILARALVAETDILLMDEPTSALDLKNQDMVLQWIFRLAKEDGLTVLFTTHHPHHALAVADNALLMLDVSEYVCGPTSDILSENNLRRVYGLPIQRLEFEFNGRAVSTLVPVFFGE